MNEKVIPGASSWLEAVKGTFDEYLAEGDYVNCQKIIRITKEEGFTNEAKQLKDLLLEATLGDFLTESSLK